MSANVLENQNLNINVSLIRMRREADESGDGVNEVIKASVPLELSAILDLRIVEATGQLGAKGVLYISNNYKYLNKLDIFTNSSDDLYVDISIVDTDMLEFGEIPVEDCELRFVGLVSSTATGSANSDDNVVIINFEEAYVAKMKQTRWTLFEQLNTGSAYDNISNMFNAFNRDKFYKLAPIHGENIMKTSDDIYSPAETLPAIFAAAGDGSVYDVMMACLSNTTWAQGPSNKPGKVASCRFKNSVVKVDGESVVSRQLSYGPLITKRHQDFIRAVASGGGGDFSDVYIETFSTGPFAKNNDPNLNIYNHVESVNIQRPDYSKLKEQCWGHYEIVDAAAFNPATMSIAPIRFQTIVDRFLNVELGNLGLGISIPTGNHYQMKKFQVNREAKHNPKQAAITLLMAQNKIFNTVINSFVVNTESISIDSPGRVYRAPGKFIKVEQDQAEDEYKKLWYVNYVQHSFSGGKYRTKIYANRFFGENNSTDIKASRNEQKAADEIYLPKGKEEDYLPKGREEYYLG